MGLLSQGTPLDWVATKGHGDHVRAHGIRQLINIHHRIKDRESDILLWGDEVEYQLVELNEEEKRASLLLKDSSLLEELEAQNEEGDQGVDAVLWHPEFASYMVEATPGGPYGGRLHDFLKVEPNMRKRRLQAEKVLGPNQFLMSLTVFPRLGCGEFTTPPTAAKPDESHSRSLFFPDEAINQHPRFATLTSNIRERRGRKVAMNVPIFRDEKTPMPYVEDFSKIDLGEGEGAAAAQADHIYMDAMGFGMGCCCLQVTFQATNLVEARHLYDQLAVVAPIVLALSASAPIFRGHLADRDCRWDVIAGSVDDRTGEESGQAKLDKDRFVIPKSRYDSISTYISTGELLKEDVYNDLDLVYDEAIFKTLQENGFDDRLARHFAHLFIRDPLVMYAQLVDQDDELSTDHFENIQSTNWQTMRFKPPPPDSPIGWRVEFRPTEAQLTDFENAAFVVFIVLLTRAILSFNLNLYIPLSKVDENMASAQKRDAVNKEVFHFRRMLNECLPVGSPAVRSPQDPDACSLMTLNEIINGKPGEFAGLIPLIEVYMRTTNVDLAARRMIARYLSLISKRASGELMTTAAWMRDFVQHHPDYKQDSLVSEAINFDLMKECAAIGKGDKACPKLLGDLFPRPAKKE